MADIYLAPGEAIPTDIRLREPGVVIAPEPVGSVTDIWLRAGETSPSDIRLVDPTPAIAD